MAFIEDFLVLSFCTSLKSVRNQKKPKHLDAGPALGGAGSIAVLCKTYSVLLCVLEQSGTLASSTTKSKTDRHDIAESN